MYLTLFQPAYVAGTFINGPDTDNGIFYKYDQFSCIANLPIQTILRDINQFILKSNYSGDTLRIFSVHLKASSGSSNEIRRAEEIDSLLKVTNALYYNTPGWAYGTQSASGRLKFFFLFFDRRRSALYGRLESSQSINSTLLKEIRYNLKRYFVDQMLTYIELE